VSVRRVLAALVCWTLLVGGVVPPVAGTVVPGPGPPATAAGPATSLESGGTVLPGDLSLEVDLATVQANNTTVRHRNPDRRDGDGDLAAVRSHLADRMGEIVVDCSRSLGTGDADPCERLNGSYGDALSKYVEVSRKTGTGEDDRTADDLRRTRREGREYARTVREFDRTYAEYREARANGNASEARRKARELRELAADAERTGGNLTRSLGNASPEGGDVREASRAVNGTTGNVTRTVEGIESELFVGTNTTARTNGSTVSFLDPLVVTGRVTTTNGTAVPDALVGLSLITNGTAENRTRVRARTNATGHYRLVYRSVTAPVGPGAFVLRLLPEVASPYLPSNATVAARVEQVDADLAVTSSPATAAYGDRFRVRVRATVDDPGGGRIPVERLPVVTRVGEFRIGSGTTDEDGRAVPDGQFPTAIRTGQRTLVVGFERTDRAIAPTSETVELDVRETATRIEATVRLTSERSIAVEGRLATADGRPLARRPLRVTLEGRSLGRLRTDENGTFEGNLTVPAAVLPTGGSADRTVRLVHDASGRNLGSTERTVTVEIPAAGAGSDHPLDSITISLVLVALLVTVGGAVVLVRRRWIGEGSDGGRSAPRDVDSGATGAPSGNSVDPERALGTIRAAMEAGDYDLVTTAGYRAVRRALAGQVGARPEATHWEFYGACAADGIDPERLEAVRGLTERFERVAFAPGDASRSVAAASLADAETVLGGGDGVAAAPGGPDADASTTDGRP